MPRVRRALDPSGYLESLWDAGPLAASGPFAGREGTISALLLSASGRNQKIGSGVWVWGTRQSRVGKTTFTGSLYVRSPPSRMGAYWYRPLNRLGDHGGHLGTELALRARISELRDLPDPDQCQPSDCQQLFQTQLADARERRITAVAIVGLGPIPVAWMLVYGLVALVRWIRRGFQPST